MTLAREPDEVHAPDRRNARRRTGTQRQPQGDGHIEIDEHLGDQSGTNGYTLSTSARARTAPRTRATPRGSISRLHPKYAARNGRTNRRRCARTVRLVVAEPRDQARDRDHDRQQLRRTGTASPPPASRAGSSRVEHELLPQPAVCSRAYSRETASRLPIRLIATRNASSSSSPVAQIAIAGEDGPRARRRRGR